MSAGHAAQPGPSRDRLLRFCKKGTCLSPTPSDLLLRGPVGTITSCSVPAGSVATTYQYNARVARVRNPKGVVTRITTNGQGWEIEVVQYETGVVLDADSGEQTTLSKAYDALGNLVATTTAGAINGVKFCLLPFCAGTV